MNDVELIERLEELNSRILAGTAKQHEIEEANALLDYFKSEEGGDWHEDGVL